MPTRRRRLTPAQRELLAIPNPDAPVRLIRLTNVQQRLLAEAVRTGGVEFSGATTAAADILTDWGLVKQYQGRASRGPRGGVRRARPYVEPTARGRRWSPS